MFLIDTNIISEAMKKTPNENVMKWLAAEADGATICTVVVEELQKGVSLMPEGKRKRAIQQAIDSVVDKYGEDIVPLDTEIAYEAGRMLASATASGYETSVEDAVIAATAKTRRMTVATRNVRHIELYGVDTLNPFEVS